MIGLWLEALKEMVPNLNRAAILFNPDSVLRRGAAYADAFNQAAAKIKVEPLIATVRSVDEIEAIVSALASRSNGGLVVAPDTFTHLHYKVIVELAARHRLPTTYQFRQAAIDGGLLSYDPDQIEIIRKSASYIDRILRGANPAELPVQVPTKFKMVINLKTADALGLKVPSSLIARADEVIE
jgi:putative ABC transport system substrate-binding protein